MKVRTKSIIYRPLAIVIDAILAYVLINFLRSFAFFNDAWFFAAKALELFPTYAKYGDLFNFLLVFYVVFCLFCFYTTLLQGVTLGHFLMGFRAQGAGISKRIAGGVRELLAIFLRPLLLFDLPILFGSPSLKERLSLTRLNFIGERWSKFTLYIVFPFLFFLGLISPMFERMALFDEINVNFEEAKREKIGPGTDYSFFKNYQSERFNFKSFSSLAENRFLLLPGFNVKTNSDLKGKSLLNGFLHVYDLQNKVLGKLDLLGEFDLLNVIKMAQSGNPLFKLRYPSITKEILDGSDLAKKIIYSSESKTKRLIAEKSRKEIEAIFKDSFSLNFTGVFRHILTNGPFLRGYLVLRRELFGDLPTSYGDAVVSIAQLGNHRFLKLRDTEISFKNGGRAINELYLPIETLHGQIFRLSFEGGEKGKGEESLYRFKQTFFANAEWYFDFEQVFKVPAYEKLYRPTHVLDYYSKELEKGQMETFHNYIYHYFFALGKMALEKNDKKLVGLLINKIENLAVAAKIINKEGPVYKKSFFAWLGSLRKALSDSNMAFFR